LLGKEFFMNKNRIFGLNARFNYMGGERISPVLVSESLERKTVIYDETMAFENQLPPTFYLDLSLSYRINKKSHSSIWTFQLKNALGSPSYDGYSYNYKTNQIQREKYTVVLPVLSYKIEF